MNSRNAREARRISRLLLGAVVFNQLSTKLVRQVSTNSLKQAEDMPIGFCEVEQQLSRMKSRFLRQSGGWMSRLHCAMCQHFSARIVFQLNINRGATITFR